MFVICITMIDECIQSTFLYLQGTVVLLANDFHSVNKMALLSSLTWLLTVWPARLFLSWCRFMNREESGWPDYLAIESQYGLKV